MNIALENSIGPAEYRQLEDAINQYNMQVTGLHSYTAVNVLLRDDDSVVRGGAVGGIWGEWFYLKYFWVKEELRGQGYGSKLFALAEAEAMAANCRGIYLETFDFQAYSLYLRLGFEVVGELRDFPPGHAYYYLVKRLR